MSMFCYQCEQTAKGKGCTSTMGVCGKEELAANTQDSIIKNLKILGAYVEPCSYDYAKNDNEIAKEINRAVIEGLFTTVTNVNFDTTKLKQIDNDIITLIEKVKTNKIVEISIDENEDIISLKAILTFGIKGAAAYAKHASILGYESKEINDFFLSALSLLAKKDVIISELLAACLKCGEINLKVMELLDKANTTTYGNPVPTQVRVTPMKGKAILVSGHDLKDLAELLKQTEGKGINVYTHGEMLPCNAYPELKQYSHLVGNYGGAWQDQKKEFAEFPGAILMTTNCIQNPAGYSDRIFTSGLVAWPGVRHISDGDFSSVIDTALKQDGFLKDEPAKFITIGFGHNAVLGVADKVITAIKDGKIKHFFLVGGCDGAKSGRNYYTEFAQKVPKDCVILTLACGKYRFNKLDFGDIDGIPRLLDIGQCNDAYSAIKIAVTLASALNIPVNDLPLSMILSWYEQKAVAILLTLLHLGIKNIKLGPSLPAFISPNVLNILVENFNIAPITTPDEDLKQILGR